MPRPKRAEDVVRALREHDKRFQVFMNRGKGSERMLYHPDINGKPESIPLTWHKGKTVGKGLLKAVIRRFNLPPDIFG